MPVQGRIQMSQASRSNAAEHDTSLHDIKIYRDTLDTLNDVGNLVLEIVKPTPATRSGPLLELFRELRTKLNDLVKGPPVQQLAESKQYDFARMTAKADEIYELMLDDRALARKFANKEETNLFTYYSLFAMQEKPESRRLSHQPLKDKEMAQFEKIISDLRGLESAIIHVLSGHKLLGIHGRFPGNLHAESTIKPLAPAKILAEISDMLERRNLGAAAASYAKRANSKVFNYNYDNELSRMGDALRKLLVEAQPLEPNELDLRKVHELRELSITLIRLGFEDAHQVVKEAMSSSIKRSIDAQIPLQPYFRFYERTDPPSRVLPNPPTDNEILFHVLNHAHIKESLKQLAGFNSNTSNKGSTSHNKNIDAIRTALHDFSALMQQDEKVKKDEGETRGIAYASKEILEDIVAALRSEMDKPINKRSRSSDRVQMPPPKRPAITRPGT